MQVSIADAKAQFAELIRRAEAGEEITVTRRGRAVARIVAAPPGLRIALIGAMKGQFVIPDDETGGETGGDVRGRRRGRAVRLLLDAHVILRAVLGDPRLSPARRDALAAPESEL